MVGLTCIGVRISSPELLPGFLMLVTFCRNLKLGEVCGESGLATWYAISLVVMKFCVALLMLKGRLGYTSTLCLHIAAYSSGRQIQTNPHQLAFL